MGEDALLLQLLLLLMIRFVRRMHFIVGNICTIRGQGRMERVPESETKPIRGHVIVNKRNICGCAFNLIASDRILQHHQRSIYIALYVLYWFVPPCVVVGGWSNMFFVIGPFKRNIVLLCAPGIYANLDIHETRSWHELLLLVCCDYFSHYRFIWLTKKGACFTLGWDIQKKHILLRGSLNLFDVLQERGDSRTWMCFSSCAGLINVCIYIYIYISTICSR